MLKHHLDGGVAKGALTQEVADQKWNDWKAQRDAKIAAKKSKLTMAAVEAAKAAKAAEVKVSEQRAEAIAKKRAEAEAEAAAKAAEAVAETAQEAEVAPEA
jgi:small subunit ribosomal protein S16